MASDRSVWKRRQFLASLGTLPAVALAEAIAARPYAPQTLPLPAQLAPVRVRGRVTSSGRGVSGVAVSDGLSVVKSDNEGNFELIAGARQPFVFISKPAGFQLQSNPSGTARFYSPLPDGPQGEVLFELQPSPMDEQRHCCLLLADPQTEDMAEARQFQRETVPDVQRLLEYIDPQPTFGIGCGDLMWDNLDLYPEYERAVSAMQVPFFQVVGNHDLDPADTFEASTQTFQRHFGPTYYSFNYGAVHYVVLNDIFWYGSGYLGYLEQSQLEWLRADLSLVEAGRPVVVAMHIPPLSTGYERREQSAPPIWNSVTNRERLYRLLEPFRAHILCGHTHESEHRIHQGIHEHIHGTVCGAWWSGPICYDGTPSGYAVYTVEGEEVRWRYKATGRPWTEQFTLFPKGADPSSPDEIVANVWNWDPAWKVFWYENGQRRGTMARRIGIDPDSRELHQGPERPRKRPWVEPMPQRHCFYAPVGPSSGELGVEVVDRFGQTYFQKVPDPSSRS